MLLLLLGGPALSSSRVGSGNVTGGLAPRRKGYHRYSHSTLYGKRWHDYLEKLKLEELEASIDEALAELSEDGLQSDEALAVAARDVLAEIRASQEEFEARTGPISAETRALRDALSQATIKVKLFELERQMELEEKRRQVFLARDEDDVITLLLLAN